MQSVTALVGVTIRVDFLLRIVVNMVLIPLSKVFTMAMVVTITGNAIAT